MEREESEEDHTGFSVEDVREMLEETTREMLAQLQVQHKYPYTTTLINKTNVLHSPEPLMLAKKYYSWPEGRNTAEHIKGIVRPKYINSVCRRVMTQCNNEKRV